MTTTPTYSFVIPVHDEQEMLGELYGELCALWARLDGPSEVLFVDDGSTDGSWSILTELAEGDPRCRLVRLSRNFGQQAAVTAGLDRTRGDAVIIMDADLQDPPEVVEEMARRWRNGAHVVYGQRTDRQQDSALKRASSAGFYRLLRAMSNVEIPAQVGDFRLVDRQVVVAMREMPERNRYVRAMFAWLGFQQSAVAFSRPSRHAGTTKYGPLKLIRLANDGIIGYSKAPLRMPLLAGAGALSAGLAGMVVSRLPGARGDAAQRRADWWPAAVIGGVQLVAIGLIGEYVGRIFDESIARPLYVVRDEHDQAAAAPAESSERNGHLHHLFGQRPNERAQIADPAVGGVVRARAASTAR